MSSEQSCWPACAVALGLACGLALQPLPASAAVYTIDVPVNALSVDGFGLSLQRDGNGTISGVTSALAVGWNSAVSYRSVLDFSIVRLPDSEKVTSAVLSLGWSQVRVVGLQYPVGSIVHLDATTPIPVSGNPNTGPADARRFNWDAVGAAPLAVSLGLGGPFVAGNRIPFDITAAVAADHLAGHDTSPFGLLEEPRRRLTLGYVNYASPRLTITTAAPDPVRYALTDLGNQRFRAHYDLRNELSLPLALMDIAFDPALYAESSLSLSFTGAAQSGWSAQWLASGIGVPAVLSLASNGSGLAGGEQATGFNVDFTWLGSGTPGAQAYTVYDATTFDTLYSGLSSPAAVVPEAASIWLMLAGLGTVLGWSLPRRPLRVRPPMAMHAARRPLRRASRWITITLPALARCRALQKLALLACTLAWIPAWAVPDLVVSSYQLQATRRLSATVYEYSYKVSATNRGTAASGAEAQVSAVRSWLTPTAGALYFGRVGAGQTVVSPDLFVIRHDRRFAFTAADLVWRFVASDATFSGRFEGPAGTPVASLLRNYLDDTAYRRSAVETDSTGRRILRTDLTVTLAPGATVGQVQPVFDALNAVVIGSLTGRQIIVLRLPDPGSLAGLELVRARLAATPGIEDVALAVFPVPALLPDNTRFLNAPPATGPDPAALSRFLGHHLAIRAHAAWNLESRINRPPNDAPMLPLPLLILTDFFGNGPPLDADGFNVIYTAHDYGTGSAPVVDGPGGYHGYEVLGQVAARFGGKDQNGPLGVLTGVVPATERRIVVKAIDLALISGPQAWMKALLTVVNDSLASNIVVNSSLVWPGGNCDGDLRVCPSPTASQKCDVEAAAITWIRLVRGEAATAPSLENQFLHVVAAGNNPAASAREVSPYAYAGTQAQVIDTKCTPNTSDDVQRPGLSNILVVEGRYASSATDATAAFGALVSCPHSTTLYDHVQGNFTPGGHISGIGSVDRGALIGPGPVVPIDRGVYLPYTNAKRFPSVTNYNTFGSGSSFAAPQVAGVALQTWAFRPTMLPQQIKGLLVATSARNQVTRGGIIVEPDVPDKDCPGTPGFHPTVDAYAAVLGADSPTGTLKIAGPNDAPARLAMLDVAGVVNGQLDDHPDGKFTQADILAFLKQFAARKGALDYSRYDINGDGYTGETYAGLSVITRRRIDLDGNLAWTQASQSVLGLPVNFDEEQGADITALVYFAYSPLYTGNEYERELLLLPYLSKSTALSPSLADMQINVTGIQSTALRLGLIDPQTSSFTSLCPAGERGTYSQVVVAAGQAAGITPVFWRQRNQGGRITNELPNADNCSSFIATIPGTGRMWLSSAARHQNTTTNTDVEYQDRFYLGEPDLEAPKANQLTPSAKRLASQGLSYGVITTPAGSFQQLATTRDFKLQVIGLK